MRSDGRCRCGVGACGVTVGVAASLPLDDDAEVVPPKPRSSSPWTCTGGGAAVAGGATTVIGDLVNPVNHEPLYPGGAPDPPGNCLALVPEPELPLHFCSFNLIS